MAVIDAWFLWLWSTSRFALSPADADGNLYVSSALTDSVLRFDAAGAAFPGNEGLPGTAEFIPSGSGNLEQPRTIAFGEDGKLYVASMRTDNVLR